MKFMEDAGGMSKGPRLKISMKPLGVKTKNNPERIFIVITKAIRRGILGGFLKDFKKKKDEFLNDVLKKCQEKFLNIYLEEPLTEFLYDIL